MYWFSSYSFILILQAEYRFIHFAIQEYLSAFDDYANFKPWQTAPVK